MGLLANIDLERELRERFGHAAFRQGQEPVIRCLLEGRSALAIFPTGAGKSLCYQLPSQLLPGMTLVVSPLLALMKDQIDALRGKGIEAFRLDSSLDEDTYREIIGKLRRKEVKLLFVAPERLSNERFLSLVRGIRISLLAVDEAHCISAWGHNFRPDYLKLARAAKELRVERVLALTATATPLVAKDIAEAFAIAENDVTNTGFHRPNLELRVTACSDAERPALLLRRIKERPPGPTIVYVSLQRHAEEVAESLACAGFKAAPYHAGLAAERRESVQEAFMDGSLNIICATIAFGMGVDKADIRYIYHYHLPKGYESYMQETGRAGRDGKPSICELFACPDDRVVLENFVYGDTPDPLSVTGLVRELLTMGPIIDIAVSDLSKRFDIRQLVVNTLLTRLELMEIIRSEGFYYGDIRLSTTLGFDAIVKQYEGAQATFLKKLFNCCTTAKKWATIDVDRVIRETGHDRTVVMRALTNLESRGLATFQMKGYRQRFRLLKPDVDRTALCEALVASFLEHERMEIARIQSMLDYAAHDGCLSGKLLAYFGETVGQCGHCGVCMGDAPAKLNITAGASVDITILNRLEALIEEYPDALMRPRQQARFLCGINSPAVSASRGLRGNRLFGTMEGVPFGHVLKACEQTMVATK